MVVAAVMVVGATAAVVGVAAMATSAVAEIEIVAMTREQKQ